MLKTHAALFLRRALIPILPLLASIGCRDEAGEGGYARSTGSTVAAAPTGALHDTIGSGSINWTPNALTTVLSSVGLDPRPMGEVRQPFMSGAGMRYHLKGGELQAYIYADAGAVARDTDRLDFSTVSPSGTLIRWRMPPTLIVSNNLALILLTNDPQLRIKVRDAVKPDLTRHDTTRLPPDSK